MNALLLASSLYSAEEGWRGLDSPLEDVCIDEVVVGVRSVGADGSVSKVASLPEPDRTNQRQVGNRRRNR